jgi:hypothetical protein
MSADLRVVAVKVPSPLRAPCPVTFVVTIENAGSDPASPAPFAVAIEIDGQSGEGAIRADFVTIVQDVEVQQLGPGARADIAVRVSIPCSSANPLGIRADVDVFHQIANNAHSASPFVLSAPVTYTSWLVTTVRVGLEDTSGVVTFDPPVLCPDKTLVAEVRVENRGCVPSPASRLDVTLEDPGMGPVPTVLQHQKVPLPPLTGFSLQVLRFRTPPAAAAGSGVLTVRAVVTPLSTSPLQCDAATLRAIVTRPIAAGGPPRASLSVGGLGSVVPGEIPSLEWSLQNDCADIGTASVVISFGPAATPIFTDSQAIGLRSTVGSQVMAANISIPPAIANAFWTVGTKTLTLEIRGSGLDPGPYRATAPLVVRPELVGAGWWTFFTAPGTVSGGPPAALWKSPYQFGGAFSNFGAAPMSLTSLDALEHPTDVTGTASDRSLTSSGSATGISVAPGSRIVAAWDTMQDWQWIALPFYVEVGPQSRTFEYTARCSLVDAFGNAYGPIAVGFLRITVTVSGNKLASLINALGFMSLGFIFTAAAVVAQIVGGYPYGTIAAIAMLAVAWGFFIAATFQGADAMDPPVPEFDRRRSGETLSEWRLPAELETSRYPGLRAFGSLLFRMQGALSAVKQARGRAWAAFIDGDDAELALQRRAAHGGLRTLRRIVDALDSAAAEEGHGEWNEIRRELRLEQHVAALSRDELVAGTQRLAEQIGLDAASYAVFDRFFAHLDDERLAKLIAPSQPVDLVRVAASLRASVDAIAADLSQREYTR